jgi:energy-coupling factor transporter ATP-binding protein EcfA2
VLREIRLKNFRCFENHVVPLRPRSIIVGKNNAGKSTLVDAFRLVSIVTSRYRALTFKPPPKWASLPKRESGVAPSLEGIAFNTTNIFHRYGEPPATIIATFGGGAEARIHLGPDAEVFAVLVGPNGKLLRTRAAALATPLPRVDIMPQVAPLSREETILSSDHVRRNLSSSLAPLHFRNQLNLLSDHWKGFKELSADSWPGLQIRELIGRGDFPGEPLQLMIRDESFVAEVGNMGHGLQMWLQTMWFLARTGFESTVILDEPDVYMHPDLQRRLIRYLKDRFPQIVVTTHSVEIISEVAPEDILIVDRKRSESRFATSIPAVQRMIENIGSAQNLQLARLWNARKCLLVEGKDFRLLSDFFDVLSPEERDGLSTIPNMSIGGWGGWPYAIGSSMLLKNSGGENIRVYCILDADYHTAKQRMDRYAKSADVKLELHIWRRKEIENYVLAPAAIARLIEKRVPRRTTPPTVAEVQAEILRVIEAQKNEVFDGVAAELWAEDRSLGSSGANKRAREIVEEGWNTEEGRLALVSGKTALSQLSRWSQEQFGVSLSASAIVRAMVAGEVAREMARVLECVAKGDPLSGGMEEG